jgi:capsule polysaccharide export protein KpsE/RkpR
VNPLIPLSGLFGNFTDESMNLISIVQSRTVMEKVITKFNLIEFYKVDNIEEALEELEDAAEFEIEEEGTIQISISVATGWLHFNEDEILAKQLCADITNAFVSELDELNKKMNVERASFHRKFIEERYLQNIKDLHTAEDKLKNFQETNNLVSINDQTAAVIESASIIKQKILLDQIQLEIYKDAFNPEYSKLEQLKKEIEEFKFKLNELQNGSINESSEDKLFLAIADIPDLGLTHLRLQRELEIQTELFKFLTMEYEEAKIEEAKDIPTVQVLDVAKVPERKSKPRRALLVISILLVCLIGNSLVIITYVNYQFNH